MKVYLLAHEHAEDVKIIGLYSTKRRALLAQKRAELLPGFKDSVEGFSVDDYEVDKDHWGEGFVTVPTKRRRGKEPAASVPSSK